jgi:hypothetical protein
MNSKAFHFIDKTCKLPPTVPKLFALLIHKTFLSKLILFPGRCYVKLKKPLSF